MKGAAILVLALTLIVGLILGATYGERYADAGSVRLHLNSDKSVTMRAYDDNGKIIAEREQSLNDPISTLWDF